MWQFVEVIRVDPVEGGWRALARMLNNGVEDTAMLPSPTLAFTTQPTDVELRIMGEHVAIRLNVGRYNPPTFTLSKFAFRNRFTLEERVAIDNAALSTVLTEEQKAIVRTILKDFEAAPDPVAMDHDSTIHGIRYFEEVRLIGPERAGAILGLP